MDPILPTPVHSSRVICTFSKRKVVPLSPQSGSGILPSSPKTAVAQFYSSPEWPCLHISDAQKHIICNFWSLAAFTERYFLEAYIIAEY